MFDIAMMKRLTRILDDPYMVSPRSSFEYILYKDIKQVEIYIDKDVENWLGEIQHKRPLTYACVDTWFHVEFEDYGDCVKIKQGKKLDIEARLRQATFNYEALALCVDNNKDEACDSLSWQGQSYFAHILDPFDQVTHIKRFYIEAIHLKKIIKDGRHLYEMIKYMASYHMDLSPESQADLVCISPQINYPDTPFDADFFEIFHAKDSYTYWQLLKDLGALAPLKTFLNTQDTDDFWRRGIEALKRMETILDTKDYFQEYICKGLYQNLLHTRYGGYSKLQLLKFSLLFYQRPRPLTLENMTYMPVSSPFCKFFSLGKEACAYYGQVVDNSQGTRLDFHKAVSQNEIMTNKEMYDFYKAFDAYTIDILLIQYVHQTLAIDPLSEMVYKEKLENLIVNYLSTYCDLKGINSQVSTLEIDHHLSDDHVLLLIDEVKEKIFLGQLAYNRSKIIDYIQSRL